MKTLAAIAMLVLLAGCGGGSGGGSGGSKIKSTFEACKGSFDTIDGPAPTPSPTPGEDEDQSLYYIAPSLYLEDNDQTLDFTFVSDLGVLDCVFEHMKTPRSVSALIVGGDNLKQETAKDGGVTYIWSYEANAVDGTPEDLNLLITTN